MSARYRTILMVPLAAVCLTGCHRDPVLTEVNGLLTLRGKPLAGVMVCFVPDPGEAGTPCPRSTGWTDAAGRYQLTCDTPRKPGAVPGTHRVVVFDPDAFDDGPGGGGGGPPVPLPPGGKKPKRLQFDVKYIMPGQTPLRADVGAASPQTIDLNVE